MFWSEYRGQRLDLGLLISELTQRTPCSDAWISRRSLGWSIISLSSASQGTSCPWKQYLYHLSICYQLNMYVFLCVGEKDLHHFLTLFYCADSLILNERSKKSFCPTVFYVQISHGIIKSVWRLGKLLKRKNFALCFTGGEALLYVSDIHYCFLITFGNNNTILLFVSFSMKDHHWCNQWRITDGLRNGRGNYPWATDNKTFLIPWASLYLLGLYSV